MKKLQKKYFAFLSKEVRMTKQHSDVHCNNKTMISILNCLVKQSGLAGVREKLVRLFWVAGDKYAVINQHQVIFGSFEMRKQLCTAKLDDSAKGNFY